MTDVLCITVESICVFVLPQRLFNSFFEFWWQQLILLIAISPKMLRRSQGRHNLGSGGYVRHVLLVVVVRAMTGDFSFQPSHGRYRPVVHGKFPS